MQRWRSHKVVEAGVIRAVHAPGSMEGLWNLEVADGPTERAREMVAVDGHFVLRHKPAVGNYLVRYADGYLSVSPAEAFEEGYTRVAERLTADRQQILTIAAVCHDANRAYALQHGETQVWPAWGDAPAEIQHSAITGVRRALEGATPEDLHESWSAQKIADGWIYGPERDNDAKVHPCLVPYDQLPEQQRRKDALFHAIVRALAS